MAIMHTPCPHCGFAIPAGGSVPGVCPQCGRPISAEPLPQEAPQDVPTPADIQVSLQQAREALDKQAYLQCADAAAAALAIDKGNPEALFYAALAAAFLAEYDISGIRAALDQVESAVEAAELDPAAQAALWRTFLGGIRQLTQQAKDHCTPGEHATAEDILHTRTQLAGLTELCINTLGYISPDLMAALPETEQAVLATVQHGEQLVAALRSDYPYFDPRTETARTASASGEIRNICSTCTAQLNAIRESLPSIAAKQEQIRRKQDASRQSVQSFWEEHAEEYSFLYRFYRRKQAGRLWSILLAAIAFGAVLIGFGFGLKGLVTGGISRLGYSLCIFGLMVFMLAYWVLFSLYYRKQDFKNNANTARRYLSSPLGKEHAVLAFVAQKQNPEQSENGHGRKKVLLSCSIVALCAILVCSLLFYWMIPAINLSKAEKAIETGDTRAAITYLTRAGKYRNAKELLAEQLAPLREQALSYESRAAAYNAILAVRDAYGDIYYAEFTNSDYPDVAITGTQGFLLTQNHIVALRQDGFVSYAQYTTGSEAAAPDVSAWSGIVRLGKLNNTVAGWQEDGTLVYNSLELDALTLARLTAEGVVGVYDKFGAIGIREDGTAALPPAENYSYPERVQQTFNKMAGWENLAIIKGDITNHFVGLTKEGRVYAAAGWFDAEYGQLNVAAWRNVIDIAAGESHTAALLADGTVVATGSNSYGQCDVSGWQDIVAIEAGSHFTMGIGADGSVYLTGNKENGAYIPYGMNKLCLLESDLEAETDQDEDVTLTEGSELTEGSLLEEAWGSEVETDTGMEGEAETGE